MAVLLFVPLALAVSAALVWAVQRGGQRAIRAYLVVVSGLVLSVLALRGVEAAGSVIGVDLAWALAMGTGIAWVAFAWRRGPLARNATAVGVAAGAGAVLSMLGVAAAALLLAAVAVLDAWMVRHRMMHAVVSAIRRVDAPMWVEAGPGPRGAQTRSLMLGSSDMVFPAALFAAAWPVHGAWALAVLAGGLVGFGWLMHRARTVPVQAGLPALAAGCLAGLAVAVLAP